MADADLYDDSDPFGDGAGGGLGAEPEPAPGVNPMFDGKAIQEVKGYLQKKSPNCYRLNRWQKRWFVMDGITLSWWERSEHEAIKEPLGSAIMADAILASDSNPASLSSEIVLKIIGKGGAARDLFLRADTLDEKYTWAAALAKAAGGSKVDLVDRLDIGSESGESSRNLEEWDSPVTGDFEIPFATIEWGTHIGKGLCSETKEGTLPELAMPLAVKTLHNFDTSDRLFTEWGRWTRALGCVGSLFAPPALLPLTCCGLWAVQEDAAARERAGVCWGLHGAAGPVRGVRAPRIVPRGGPRAAAGAGRAGADGL